MREIFLALIIINLASVAIAKDYYSREEVARKRAQTKWVTVLNKKTVSNDSSDFKAGDSCLYSSHVHILQGVENMVFKIERRMFVSEEMISGTYCPDGAIVDFK